MVDLQAIRNFAQSPARSVGENNGGSKMSKAKNLSYLAAVSAAIVLSGCATIVNDSYIPLAFAFSDGSTGNCDFKNKRGSWSSEIPAQNVMIRRSDDALNYDCETEDGREASGSIRSEVEGEKVAASVIFWDLGITDAITDKHRTYQGNITIPVPAKAKEESPAPEAHDDPAEAEQV
jgi:hypothetical protein